jgi:hypothetical protein
MEGDIMKKSLLLSIVLLLGTFSINHAMEVQFPSKEDLNLLLFNNSLGHFAARSGIADFLAGQKRNFVGINRAIKLSHIAYSRNNPIHPCPGTVPLMRILLSDHPEALNHLRQLYN